MSNLKGQASLRRASAYKTNDQSNDLQMPPVPSPARSRVQLPPSSAKPPRPDKAPPQIKASMDRRKSRVDGMLQRKRQSISYSSAEAHRMAQSGSNVPALPSMPRAYAEMREEPSEASLNRIGPGGLNMEELNTELFEAQECEFISSLIGTNDVC